MEISNFKIAPDKTGWVERNELIGRIMKLTGHPYWGIRRKTGHLDIDTLNRIYYQSKDNPKKFYWLLKK